MVQRSPLTDKHWIYIPSQLPALLSSTKVTHDQLQLLWVTQRHQALPKTTGFPFQFSNQKRGTKYNHQFRITELLLCQNFPISPVLRFTYLKLKWKERVLSLCYNTALHRLHLQVQHLDILHICHSLSYCFPAEFKSHTFLKPSPHCTVLTEPKKMEQSSPTGLPNFLTIICCGKQHMNILVGCFHGLTGT